MQNFLKKNIEKAVTGNFNNPKLYFVMSTEKKIQGKFGVAF